MKDAEWQRFLNTPWWKFWHPMSGMAGGLIMGALIGIAIGLMYGLIVVWSVS